MELTSEEMTAVFLSASAVVDALDDGRPGIPRVDAWRMVMDFLRITGADPRVIEYLNTVWQDATTPECTCYGASEDGRHRPSCHLY